MVLQHVNSNKKNNCMKKFQLSKDRSLGRNTKLCQFRVNKCLKSVSYVQNP